MQVRIKVEHGTEFVKHVKIKVTPKEYLIISNAMKRFADDETRNEEDRKIMQLMLAVNPSYKYTKKER